MELRRRALQGLAASVGESPLCAVACDASDEFQASLSNALVGFYRFAFPCLRNALENLSIGLELELSSDSVRFNSWQSGDIELNLGWAADVLPSHSVVASIENHCKKVCADNFFRQRSPTDNGGVVRRLFKKLSKFTHGTPGFTDADMRNSNGSLFQQVTDGLPSSEDGVVLLKSLPVSFW